MKLLPGSAMLRRTVLATVFFLAVPVLATAVEVRISVTDGELDFPLEGVKINMQENPAFSAESDASGEALLSLPDDFVSGVLILQLPGYRSAKMPVQANSGRISVLMTMADVIEGKELVVERAAPGKTDEKSGVSLVMDKKQMETTAKIGLVEDVMSSVNTLPGVAFSGNWNSEPSIRGGYPREMATVLDGIYMVFPWHWGGAYSIFNPGMVDSVKMSNGIFSARYGRALSGLLEVTTLKPVEGQPRIDLSITSLSTDFFLQLPFGKKAGLFLGGKCTYMETLVGTFRLVSSGGETDMLKTVPYIRDFYTKGYFNPTPDLAVSVNAFFGSDGIEIGQDETKDGLRSRFDFDYVIMQAFSGIDVKWLPVQNTQLHTAVAYNWMFENVDIVQRASGKIAYNDDFLQKYGSLLNADALAAGTYSLDQTDTIGEEVSSHQIQGKLEADIEVAKNAVVSFGGEAVWQRSDTVEKTAIWRELNTGAEYPSFDFAKDTITAEGNNLVNSAAFALCNFGSETTVLSGELGTRVDHFYLWNNTDDFDIQTYPVINPRASVQATPWRNTGIFEKITFSAGVGVFSCLPREMVLAEKRFNIKDFDIGPNRAIFGVLGTEFALQDDWNFKLEGYYKHYLSRMYIVGDDRNLSSTDYTVKTDGEGYSTGFDLMLQKKNGHFWDGYLSYSFINSRFKNPLSPQYAGQATMYDEPLGEWYYPDFHRFHTMNLVLNFKPTKGLVLTVKGTLASGTPKKEDGSIYCYPAKMDDGTVMQRYTRSSFYSDTLRTQISCPVDVRVSYSGYFKNSKVRWEYYIGAEDIFLNLYTPEGAKSFNSRTGKVDDTSTDANFNIGIPMVSVGLKLSY